MSTIDSKEIVRKLLLNNGHFETDPQAYSIWSYVNNWGKKTQCVFYHPEHEDLHNNPYVSDPRLLWKRGTGNGITFEGKLWIIESKLEEKKENA